MKILVVSRLYPDSRQERRDHVSYALHDLVHPWTETDSVYALRLRRVQWRKPWLLGFRIRSFEGVRVVTVPLLRIALLDRFFFELTVGFFVIVAALLRFRPDRVVAHLNVGVETGRLIAALYRVPLIVGLHVSDLQKLRSGKERLYTRALAQSAHVAVRSRVLRRQLLELYPQLAGRTALAESGVSPGIVAPETVFHDSGRQLSERRVRAVTAAALIPRKHILESIRAFEQLSSSVDWRYCIIGDGPEMARLRDYVRKRGLVEQIEFTGYLPHSSVLEEMRTANLFVMISRAETFGLGYLEALASGCLVIASRGTGIDGLVHHGRNAFLCDPGESSELAALIERVVSMDVTSLTAILDEARSLCMSHTATQTSREYLRVVRGAK